MIDLPLSNDLILYGPLPIGISRDVSSKFLFFREAIKLSNKIIYLNIREKIKKNIFKELNADEATKYVRSKTEGL